MLYRNGAQGARATAQSHSAGGQPAPRLCSRHQEPGTCWLLTLSRGFIPSEDHFFSFSQSQLVEMSGDQLSQFAWDWGGLLDWGFPVVVVDVILRFYLFFFF